jgi:hypothetical protein
MTHDAIAMVEQVIGSFGLSPEECRTPARDGTVAWSIGGEHAEVLIFLNSAVLPDVPETLRIVSPTWRPPNGAGAETWKTLLALSGSDLVGAAFVLIDDVVLVVTERPTLGLTADFVDFMVRSVGSAADRFQPVLIGRFGGSAP